MPLDYKEFSEQTKLFTDRCKEARKNQFQRVTYCTRNYKTSRQRKHTYIYSLCFRIKKYSATKEGKLTVHVIEIVN